MTGGSHAPTAPAGPGRGGRLRRRYGAGPGHLLGHLAVIALAAYVLSIIFEPAFAPRPLNLALWLLGGAVLHDLVFLPAYSLLGLALARLLGATGTSDARPPAGHETDRSAAAAGAVGPAGPAAPAPSAAAPTRDTLRPVPLLNHVRVPVVISAVLLLTFLPRIADRQPQNFVNALGYAPPDFLARWLWVSAALVGGSALIYAARRVAARRRAAQGS